MRAAAAGVQRKIQNVYQNAQYIHRYTHQLNLIMRNDNVTLVYLPPFFPDHPSRQLFLMSSIPLPAYIQQHEMERSQLCHQYRVIAQRELIHSFESIRDLDFALDQYCQRSRSLRYATGRSGF